MAVGERIREEREKRAWTQGDLSTHSGTNRDTISGIESGRHRPRPSTLRKIAGAFGLEVRDLFEEAKPSPKAPPDVDALLSMPAAEFAEYAKTLSEEESLEVARAFDEHYRHWQAVLQAEKDAGRGDGAAAQRAYREMDRNSTPAMILMLVRTIKRGYEVEVRPARRELEKVLQRAS